MLSHSTQHDTAALPAGKPPASFIIQEQRKKYNICVWELLKNGLPYGMMPCI
ncbi:hypothetical protein ANACOL_02725 [Anaerotruncus colihominis DSM 17241]|uniref:Uncharacterized protein n=1 Tax=Anaerotruncus colihominis DSM 17241 TaxID=445972 RepID=B0PDU0_9FIRM|nr:hypothetical protein ANACOL_02725 [Anaerotruncus colihominis DSM 17241]